MPDTLDGDAERVVDDASVGTPAKANALALVRAVAPAELVRQRRLKIAVGLTALDNRPYDIGLTWRQFLILVSRPRSVDVDLAECLADKMLRSKHKDGPYFNTCGFNPSRAAPGDGWRTKDCALESEVWVGDFDTGELDQIEIRARLQGMEHVGYTTFSNSGACAKFRVVVLLARAVNDSEYKALDALFRQRFMVDGQDSLDPKGANRVQIWYLPAHPRDAGGQFSFWHNAGEPFDPDTAPLTYPEAKESTAAGMKEPGAARVVESFNAQCTVGEVLSHFGYRQTAPRRYLAPGSTSGAAGVTVFDNNVCYSHHSPTSDPLADGKPHDAFDVYRLCQWKGNWAQALQDARIHLRIPSSLTLLAGPGAFDFQLDRGRLDSRFTTKPKPRDFVVEGFLLAGKPGVLAGFGGASKTQLALELAMAIALGRTVLGMKAGHGCAMLVLGEEDQEEVDRRIGAIAHHWNLAPEDAALVSKRVIVWPAAGEDVRLTAESPDGIKATGASEKLMDRATALSIECGVPVRLIALDHLMLCAGGEANKNEDATQFTREATKIARATGSAVLTLAHSPKAAATNNTVDQTAVRGASAIVDNSRMAALLVGMSEKEATAYGIANNDRTQYSRLEIVKNNYGKTGQICWVQRIIVPEYESVTLQRVTLVVVPKGLRSKNSTVGNPIDKIVELVGNEPGRYSVKSFAAKFGGKDSDFGIGINKLESLVKNLVADGTLERRPPTAAERKQYAHASNVRDVLALKVDATAVALPAVCEVESVLASEGAYKSEEHIEKPIENVQETTVSNVPRTRTKEQRKEADQ